MAIKTDPHYTLAKLDLAITLLEEGKKAQAESLLKEGINAKKPSWRSHWLIWERPKAEALLNAIDKYMPRLDTWHQLM